MLRYYTYGKLSHEDQYQLKKSSKSNRLTFVTELFDFSNPKKGLAFSPRIGKNIIIIN